jgi:hypothetical protein
MNLQSANRVSSKVPIASLSEPDDHYIAAWQHCDKLAERSIHEPSHPMAKRDGVRLLSPASPY